MKPSSKQLIEELRTRGINPSCQRLRILEYLVENRCHPTTDQIFTDLQKDIPTLSKTTVYNTLRVLAEAGLARVVTIEDRETRYDSEVKDHGHFKCESCGAIYDFKVDTSLLTPEALAGFKISDKNVYFRGICPACL